MIVRRLLSLALLLATVAVMAFAPHSARAGGLVPFKGHFSTVFESVLAFPFLQLSVSGHGNASHLGATTAVTTNQLVNVIDGSATATYTLTGANGDKVVLATSFQATNVPGGVTFAGTYTVAGGSGRFAGAMGSGSLTGSATFTGPSSGFGSFSVEGTISSPGSLKK